MPTSISGVNSMIAEKKLAKKTLPCAKDVAGMLTIVCPRFIAEQYSATQHGNVKDPRIIDIYSLKLKILARSASSALLNT